MKSKTLLYMTSTLASLMVLVAACSHEPVKPLAVKAAVDPQIEKINNALIQKSPNDDRTYAAMMLNNHLQVVVVSDPTLENSVASLAVNVGSAQDPETQPGLAHYLEHMLFLGTQRYPEPDGFMKYTQANGGMTNAFTRYDKTNYFFMISASKFDEALDRFSDYFKAPTFDPNYSDKERSAVSNEWSMQKAQDNWNIQRISGLTANPQSPYQKFNIGNLETLSDKPNAKLQEQVKQFYQQYYSANVMRLTLVGKQSIPELKALAEKYFSAIPNKNVVAPVVSIPGLTEKEFAKNIYYKPLKDIKELLVEFPVKSNKEDWPFKANYYVQTLLTSEEPGTLCEQLRKKGLANNVTAYYQADAYGPDGFVRVVAELTDLGVAHQDEITAAVFAYVELIKREGLNVNYFKELKAVGSKGFANYAKPHPVQQAVEMTLAQFDLPVENLLNSNYVYQDYRPDLIQAQLNNLDARKARVWHISQKETVDTLVKNFDGQYAIKSISDEEFSRLNELAKKNQFNLPPLNNLFTDAAAPIVENSYLKPHLVLSEKGVEAFLVHPEFYREDKGLVSVELNSPMALASAKNMALSNVLNEVYKKQTLTLGDRASRAGLGVAVNLTASNSQAFYVSGYTTKHAFLVNEMLKMFASMDITQKDFDEAQKSYLDSLQNKSKTQVFQQAYAQLNRLTHKIQASDETLIAETKKLNLKDLQNYWSALKRDALLRVFVAGNYSEESVKQMASAALNQLPLSRKPDARSIAHYVTPALGERWEYRQTTSLADDAVMLTSFRPAKSDDEQAQLMVLNNLFGNAFFMQLRTEEQLGYVVQSSPYPVDDVPGFFMLVQSSNTPVEKIVERVNKFRQEYLAKLEATDPHQIEQTKQAILNNILQKPTDFYREIGLYSNEFWHAKYAFDGRDRNVAALKKVTKADLIAIYQQLVLNPKSGSVLVQLKGTNFKDAPFVKFGKIVH